MSHNKTKLLFRVFHYLTLYVVLFNFIIYPAYAIVEHFPYGMSSRYAFPYIRLYEAGYGNESDKVSEAKEATPKTRQINSNNSKSGVVAEHFTSMVIVEYSAPEKSGSIGNSSAGFDDPSDNIFTLEIDKKQLQGKEVVLQYDLYGIENVSGVSKSINEHTATGGTVIKRNEEWKTVQETVSAAQFKNGTNYLLFTGFDNTNYSIRNLKLLAISEKRIADITLVDGTTLYLQNGNGYVKGVSSQNSAELYIQGKLVKTKDGVFETVIVDADKLNQIDYVLLDKSGKTISSGSLPIHNKVEVTLLNNQKSAYGKTFISDLGNEEFAIDTENVSFNINKKNYEQADKISVQQLRAIDMAPLGTNVINVTASKSGYRFLPDGAKFSDNALVGIKYDTLYLPKGYTPADIKVLYFDMGKRRWLSIPTDTIVKNQSKIIANTTHFTDYIAGVIQAPESPETSSFTPTSISDIQVANPTANIVQIQPPTANQQGDGTVDFPITLPPGRAGLQPNLSVSYNNNGSSGIVGQGWDINIPVISVDTRFGVPTYDPDYETESYLLNGEEIMMKGGISFDNGVFQQSYYLPHRSDSQRARSGTDVEFFPKVESSFTKIIRKGDSPSNYYWEIWDKSGTKYTYGGDKWYDSSVLRSHFSDPDAKRAKWYLSEVKDKNNNVIWYNYEVMPVPTSGAFKDGMEVRLKSIQYNRNSDFNTQIREQNRGYTVFFKYKSTPRGDAQINYRFGFKENSTSLLDMIIVSCFEIVDGPGYISIPQPNNYGITGGQFLPCENEIEYAFNYNTQGPFAKTLLTKITTKNIKIDMSTGLPAETQQYEHQFQYHNDIAGGLFKAPESIFVDKDFSGDKHAILSSTVENFNSSHFGFSAGVSTSVQPPVWWPFSNSGTVNMSFPSPTSTSSSPTMMLMDIDGDGLDDKVMKIGNKIKYRKNLAGLSFSKQLYDAHHIGDLGLSESNTKTDPEFSFSLLFLNMTSSKSQSNSRSRNYFTDVNNDGLVDYVKDRIVYFNRMDPGSMMPSFTADSNLTPNVIMRDGEVDASVSQGLPEFETDSGLMDIVKVWVAPRNGNISISGNITKPFVASHNGVRFSVEHGKDGSTFSSYLINPTLLVNATLPTSASTYVNTGDHIYFRVNSSQLPDREVTVDWNPTVAYTSGGTESSNFNGSFLFGDVEAEPLTIREPGTYRIVWDQSALSLPNGSIQFSVRAYTLATNSSAYPPRNYLLNQTQTVSSYLSYPSIPIDIPANSVQASNPNTYIYVEIEAVGTINSDWKVFDNAFEPKLRKLSDNSFVHIVPKYEMNNSVAKDLGVGTLYKNWGQFAYKGALPDQDFTPIKKALVSKAKLAGNNSFSDPNAITPNPIMTSQSGSVVYNFANGTFYSGLGGSPYTIPTDQKEAMEHFMMLRSDRARLAWSAHPRLMVKGLSMSPNYRSDNSNYTPMTPVPAPTGVGTYGAYAIVKESTSVSQSSNWSVSFYGFGTGKGENRATSQPINDYMDLNGDGYPDIVGERIQFTSNKGGLTDNFLDRPLMAASLSSGSGNTIGGGSSHLTQIADPKGRFSRLRVGDSSSFSPSVSANGSKFETVTAANHILLDLNGDGLADIVKPNGDVEFNTSAGFVVGSWSNYDKPNVSKTTSSSLGASLGVGFSDFQGLFPSNLLGSFLSQSNLDLSFGVNGSRSTTQRERDFVDINGDGLPDFISGNSVKINNGTAFSSTSYSLDRMSESTSFSIGTNLSLYVLFPIPILGIIVVKVGGGGGTSFGKNYNEDNVSLRDFNGDGYPDIVETVSEHEIKVQYSKIGRTNMLKKIINPTGSTIELDYGTQNKIDGTSIGSTYKMPFKKWVLTSTKVNDGFTGDGENIQEYAFEYYNGFKDRRERKFLGFGEVKTHQLNSSGKVYRTIIQEYLLNDMATQHVYLPGSHSDSRKYQYIGKLPKRTRTFDGMNRVLNEVYNAYNIYRRPYLVPINHTYNTTIPASTINYTDTSSIVPLLSNVNTTTYHYSVGGGGTSNEVVSRFKEYDMYGNVTKFDEEINGPVTNSVQIAYHYLTTGGKYNVSTPASHNLNNYQRYSTTTLDAKGNVNQIIRYKDYGSSGSQVSTSDFVFDLFGNLTKVTLPAPNAGSSSAQRMSYNFYYDNFFHKNMTMITDSQGYQSQTTYNHFGLVTSQKDMNNVEIFNEYDPSLRLIKVKGPYNSQWTIKHEYKKNPATGRYYAITKHNIKDESVTPGEQILHTSSFADGLGRIIQTKKQLDLAQECGAASTGYRFAVSGIQIYDEFGRVVESDLSQERIDCSGNFTNELESYTALTRDPLLKTTMIYDMQDRVLQSHVHGLNASTIYEYGHDFDQNNVPRPSEKVTLPEGNVSQTLKDAKGQVVLTRQIDVSNNTILPTAYSYNSIGELLSVTDADNKTTTYQYDTFGQKTQVTHPDNGVSKFEYDLAGKLIASTNQNLLTQNSSARVQYNYVFNQLQSVSYPGMMSNGVQIPASTVSYTYGGNGAPNYSAGRIVSVNDLTGTKSFEYGKLGEVVKENRELQTAVGNLNFTTRYQYDTWGRMLNMTYPDGEVVTYGYNPTGQLVSIFNNMGDFYLKNVTYNFFDQPVEIDYGNDVKTVNTYDLTQRVRSMRLDRPDTTTFMHNVYDYDKNQNIVKIANGSSQHPLLKMGGISNKSYEYDGFNRLASASGQWSGGDNESHDYSLTMAYNNTHGIVNKNQHHNVQSPAFNGLSDNTYDAKYEYNDPAHPHAVSSINYGNLSGSQSAVSNFAYDDNGNLTNYNTTYNSGNPGSFTNRDMVWDQQNRLLAVVDDNTKVSHYIYDHAGERTFKSVGAITQVNIGGAAIHQVLDFNDYMVYPSGYIVVNPGKDEYSKHYYINGKRFASRLEIEASVFINGPLGRQATSESATDTAVDGNAVEPLDLSAMMGVQNTVMGFTIGNTESDCLTQVNNIVTAYQNLNNNTGGSIQNCVTAIVAIKNKIGTNGYDACDALVEINAYVCTPVTPGNTPGSTPTPSFTAEQLMQFDCLTELNILIGTYTAASDALDQQQSMMRGGNFKYGCNGPYEAHNCCWRYQQTGVWDCPECPDLTPEDCGIVPVEDQTEDWQACIKDCLHNGTNPGFGAHCWEEFLNTGRWLDDCFIWLVECDHCSDLVGVTKPDEEEVNCLRSCTRPGMGQCLEYYDAYGVWTKECNDIGKECGCIRDEGNEEEEIRTCVQDCPNPRASECYDYYLENGVWMDDCEEVMTECGCYDFGTELDCYKQALNYIRKHLTFEPNNACAVLAYVKENFKCYTPEIVRPETPVPFPDLQLPTPDPESNDDLPDRDGPYDEDQRKPIWWYHTDHLGSSTYLTDNFGRPSHYYETLPFGEMMVEHNQSANVPSGVGYDNKYKFNGKELDDATQMYYYGARYYDPRISIFVSVDPLAEQTMEPYLYTGNNPIMFTDPTGMSKQGGGDPFVFSRSEFTRYLKYINNNAGKTGKYGYGPSDRHDCVTTVNRSLRVLLGNSSIPAVANMDNQMKKLQSLNYAGSSMKMDFKDSNNNKTIGLTNPTGFFDKSLTDLIKENLSQEKGFQFFGMSVMDGYHSLMVVVDNSNSEYLQYQIYDQHGGKLGVDSRGSFGTYSEEEVNNWLLDFVGNGNETGTGERGRTTTTLTPIRKKENDSKTVNFLDNLNNENE